MTVIAVNRTEIDRMSVLHNLADGRIKDRRGIDVDGAFNSISFASAGVSPCVEVGSGLPHRHKPSAALRRLARMSNQAIAPALRSQLSDFSAGRFQMPKGGFSAALFVERQS
jgi:hypothetical protein